MRKYLLPESGTFYKANLHCHSTLSDGHWTPEEIKERYKEKGYSVVAYTDHGTLYSHNELCDESFVALNGVEIAGNNIVDGKPAKKFRKNCELCMIALSPDTCLKSVCNKKEDEAKAIITYDEFGLPCNEFGLPYKLKYDPDVVNSAIDRWKKYGFFVTHNHPAWSREDYGNYIRYRNMHAMEIHNYGSACGGHDEYNSKIYDEQLRAGKRLYCIATDDNHNKPWKPDSFGGFTMIKAERLAYETITDALVNGSFYASEGPLINELYFEDGKACISSSPAQAIFITKPGKNVAIRKEENGLVETACFDIEEDDGYFFITVVGENGRKAYTNAYFTEDLFNV